MRYINNQVWSSGEGFVQGRGILELICMCVFFEAPDLYDNSQGEDAEEWRGGEKGTTGNAQIRVTQKLTPLGDGFSSPCSSRTLLRQPF